MRKPLRSWSNRSGRRSVRQVPDARLIIVGTRGELTAVYPSRDPSVTFTGFVDDLDAWYRKARVICCPIYYGAGTRVKIIEAAAHAKAVVSTTVGAEGLDFENEREIILRDGAKDLAEACVHLLRDASAAARIGEAARDKARLTYDRGFLIDRLARQFSNDPVGGNRHSAHA